MNTIKKKENKNHRERGKIISKDCLLMYIEKNKTNSEFDLQNSKNNVTNRTK